MSARVFGPEVYRLTSQDTQARQMTVPLRLSFLEQTSPEGVAQELASMHKQLNVSRFHVVPEQKLLAKVINTELQSVTGGACEVSTGSDTGMEVDVVISAGSAPTYRPLAEEFYRLARWTPGKQAGYVLVAEQSAQHMATAWQAFAIESRFTEEAISQAAFESGSRNRALKWDEIPGDMRSFFDKDEKQKPAEKAVWKAVRDLSDEWDSELGRLSAWKIEKNRDPDPKLCAEMYGYRIGVWLMEQRRRWQFGNLDQRKVNKLKNLGVMLDLEEEVFARGLRELRTYVQMKKKRYVSPQYKSETGFKLGEWVLWQRVLMRRGKLGREKQELLKEAFFVWSGDGGEGRKTPIGRHPDNEEAAELTMSIEDEMREMRWRPLKERRTYFRQLVLTHHPDVSSEKHAEEAIKFLADAKQWFLA
jgi:hypothetical protein